MAGDIYQQRYGSRGFEGAEEALAALASHFLDDYTENRAYTTFHNLTFRGFRNQNDNRSMTEEEKVKLFYSKLLCCQSQMGPKNGGDIL